MELNRTFDFRSQLLIFAKLSVVENQQLLGGSSYFSIPGSVARVSRKYRNSGEMASDALWVVSFKCVVKGYRDCRFDVKEGEDFRVLKKINEKGRAFRIVNERGQLGHLQRELVSCFPVACKCFDNLVSEDVCGGIQ